MSEERDPTLPIPLGMFLCDSVSREMMSGKIHLNGLFGAIISPNVPARANFSAYATFTNVRSALKIWFEIVDAEENVLQRTPEMDFPLPDDMIIEPIAMVYVSVEFPSYGHYFVRFFANTEYIMERRIVVIEPSPPPQQESP